MISRYDVIKALKAAQERGDDIPFHLSPDEKLLLKNSTDEPISTLDDYVSYLRKKLHCDFESIYSEHATLTEVYRCRQCGTVIFGGDDEDHYNTDEKCPTCCKDPSVTWNKYWTKEEIDADLEKQATIKALENEMARQRRHNERRQMRNGLYDWQRWKKVIKTKKHSYRFQLICTGYDGDIGRVPKGQHGCKYLQIDHWNFEKEDVHDFCKIPLNFYAVYIFFILPYLKSTHPDVRKYTFWQRKPEKGQLLAVGDYIYTNFHLPEVVRDPVKMKIVYITPDTYTTHYEAKAVNWNHTLCFCNADICKTVFRTKKLAMKYNKYNRY